MTSEYRFTRDVAVSFLDKHGEDEVIAIITGFAREHHQLDESVEIDVEGRQAYRFLEGKPFPQPEPDENTDFFQYRLRWEV